VVRYLGYDRHKPQRVRRKSRAGAIDIAVEKENPDQPIDDEDEMNEPLFPDIHVDEEDEDLLDV
jgi:hypothetical protein